MEVAMMVRIESRIVDALPGASTFTSFVGVPEDRVARVSVERFNEGKLEVVVTWFEDDPLEELLEEDPDAAD